MNDYTAILTKVRAMRSQLLSPEDIQNNPNLKKPEDIYQLLQKTEGYNRAIQEIDMTEFTPKTIIPIINNGVYYTFLKLYRFANLKQRRSEEHTSELQSRFDIVCRLLLEKKKHHYN